MLSLISSIGTNKLKVLDIGCGFGRYLRPLSAAGHDVLGIERNERLVAINKSAGLNCCTPENFQPNENGYDLIIMSHIIEHFEPHKLLEFFNSHLKLLNCNGVVLIATPLWSNYFYDDFDHCKPYHPAGVSMILSEKTSQVQFGCEIKMTLTNIWFRRSPFRVNFQRNIYVSGFPWGRLMNLLSGVLFRVSFKLCGRTDGWVGLYKRLSSA